MCEHLCHTCKFNSDDNYCENAISYISDKECLGRIVACEGYKTKPKPTPKPQL